jgi:sugar/nucleoside kinase (ribokinase family)
MTVDAFNVKSNGRRTHFYHQGVAATMSPENFDFSRSHAKILHLGLPGAHKRMDEPWRGEANGWVVTLAAARREGIAANLELMTTGRERIAELARPCLPHLDFLIVNDYEIGAVAGMETRRDGAADPPAIRAALAAALAQGAMRLAVAHFPEGAIALTREGAGFAVGSVAAPKSAIAGVNGAGDAFAAGLLYGLHEERAIEDALRLGHACAAASMRAVSTTAGVGSVAECLALAEQWGLRPPPV